MNRSGKWWIDSPFFATVSRPEALFSYRFKKKTWSLTIGLLLIFRQLGCYTIWASFRHRASGLLLVAVHEALSSVDDDPLHACRSHCRQPRASSWFLDLSAARNCGSKGSARRGGRTNNHEPTAQRMKSNKFTQSVPCRNKWCAASSVLLLRRPVAASPSWLARKPARHRAPNPSAGVLSKPSRLERTEENGREVLCVLDEG
jgi:hypothetical protein